jgi:outer membrane protein
MQYKLIPLLCAVPLAFLAQAAAAQASTVKLGYAAIDLSSRTTGLSGIGVPPGADIQFGDATTLTFGYEHKFSPQLSIEIAAGIPPKHDTVATGPIAFLGTVFSVKQFAPTIFLNYSFGQDGAVLRPFVGIGANYTKFIDAKSNLGQNIELSDSVGLAVQAGLQYAISKQWGVYAVFAMADVKSDLVATANTVQRTNIDFRPKVFSAGLSYKF